MPSLTDPLHQLEKVTAARRLAVGFSVGAVARAANRTVDLIDGLTREADFMQLVAGWHDLLSLPPKVRTARLMKLAHAALEAALAQGGRTTTSTALALIELEQRRIDPVERLAQGLSRIAEREIRRVQKAAAAEAAAPAAAAPAGEAAPDATASPGSSNTRERTEGRFTQRVDAVAARLRARIIAEQGWTAEPLSRHELNLSDGPPATASAEAAAETATTETTPTPAEAPAEPDGAALARADAVIGEALESMMRDELAAFSAEKQKILAGFSPDDWTRLFLEMMRPAGPEPKSEAAEPGKGGGWPGGP